MLFQCSLWKSTTSQTVQSFFDCSLSEDFVIDRRVFVFFRSPSEWGAHHCLPTSGGCACTNTLGPE